MRERAKMPFCFTDPQSLLPIVPTISVACLLASRVMSRFKQSEHMS